MSLPFSSKPMVSGSPPLSSIRFSVSSAGAFSFRRVSTSAQESPGCLFMFSENLLFNVSIIAVSFLQQTLCTAIRRSDKGFRRKYSLHFFGVRAGVIDGKVSVAIAGPMSAFVNFAT